MNKPANAHGAIVNCASSAALLVLGVCASSSCASSTPTGETPIATASGGAAVSSAATGGVTTNTAGGAATTSAGGSVAATGGANSPGVGGNAPGVGGSAPGVGGLAATGGATSLGGGTSTVGGSTSAGGLAAIGGATALGGSTSTIGGSSNTGGLAATAGAAPVVKDCANMATLTTGPLLTNFETYDGATAAGASVFSFNGVWPAAVYMGPYGNTDGTGTFALAFVGGANASNWALDANNTQATLWGGGIGFWMGCINASAYSGLSFYARGTTPAGTISVSLAMEDTSAPNATNPAGGGTCTIVTTATAKCSSPSTNVPLTADWTLVQIPWASLIGGMGLAGTAVTATGARITGLAIGANMIWQDLTGTGVYTAAPGAFDIQIDDLGFY